MHYYEVAPTKLVRPGAQVFTYHSETPYTAGCIVMIPVGKKSQTGIIIRSVPKPSFTTRSIESELIQHPLPLALIKTAYWISDYYATHLGIVLPLLLPRGLTKKRRTTRIAEKRPPIRERKTLVPTTAQQAAIEAVVSSPHTTHLLFGVTGSGKTLVYKQLAQRTISAGRSVIVLVPEIALTSQLVDEFLQEFPEQVILAHSQQTEVERHLSWQRVLDSPMPLVVVGARSALFMPLASVGLIVVDEMHEPTYKQEQAPRYSALRVATILAGHHNAKVLFGSATPPVAEYYAALQAGAPILRLPARAHPEAVAPSVSLINMTKRGNFTQHRFLSDVLLRYMTATLEANKQVLLFHNRRGSAALTLCEHCGWTATDPDTGVPLTLHADSHNLVSHITGYTRPVPTACPVCGKADIIHKGIGTKLIEDSVQRLFPNKKIVRFDGDSGNEHSVDSRYAELYQGSIDIIIGTQVIAKGIDLPHLETVGVIQADAGLALPDFTSRERVFQLISQTVGRVGRGAHATNIVVQSYQPDHSAIVYGTRQDYAAFYEQELAQRKAYSFPPFAYLLKFVCSYKTEQAAIKQTRAFAQTLRKVVTDEDSLLGPAPAFYERQAGTYHWQITVRSPRRARLVALVELLPNSSHWQYEIDPSGLL